MTESFISDKYGAVYHSRPPEILGGLRDFRVTERASVQLLAESSAVPREVDDGGLPGPLRELHPGFVVGPVAREIRERASSTSRSTIT